MWCILVVTCYLLLVGMKWSSVPSRHHARAHHIYSVLRATYYSVPGIKKWTTWRPGQKGNVKPNSNERGGQATVSLEEVKI